METVLVILLAVIVFGGLIYLSVWLGLFDFGRSPEDEYYQWLNHATKSEDD